MPTIEHAARVAWKLVLLTLLVVALISIISANRVFDDEPPASWSVPSNTVRPWIGPVLRTT